MIHVVEHENIYKITFPYHPGIVDIVKTIPGRWWHKDEKYWSIPKNHLGMLINAFTGTEFQDMVVIRSTEHINVNQTLDATTEIPDIDISSVKEYVKSGYSLYNHQKDFLKYAIDRQNNGNLNGFVVCDEPGLGKTIEAINLALYNKEKYEIKHCLIICCVNTSKYNWQSEVFDHTNGEYEGYILGTRKLKRGGINYNGSSQDKLEDLENLTMYGEKDGEPLPYFLIMNVESLRMKVKKTKKFPLRNRLLKLINDNIINMIVVDEVHKNLSPSSIQGSNLIYIKDRQKSNCIWLPMTGTPIVNQPTDLFLTLKLVNAHSIKTEQAFKYNFCVFGGFGMHEIIGYKNIDMLKSLLQGNMIRRTKEDVLDLPDKIEMIEYVENTKYQQRLMSMIIGELGENKESIISSLNPLAQMMRLRQVNGSPEIIDCELEINQNYFKKNAKITRLVELLDDILARDEKVIVFSNWVEPLRTIYTLLSDEYNMCVFTGTMNEKTRQNQKQKFLKDPESKILLGTIGALGTTHTLTVANNVIFYDEPWTAADRQQAIDRVHRISTSKAVNIYTLLSKDTIDERVHNLLYSKKVVSSYIVDNQLDLYNNPELFDMLLGN